MLTKKVTKIKKQVVKTKPKSEGLSLSVYDGSGKSQGRVTLPKEIFQAKISSTLLAQSLRVYSQNQRMGASSTKTRAEVSGGGRKPWRQKGTGRARVGSIRVPNWRGGGIVFGPKSRQIELNLSSKMRRKALFDAFTSKFLSKKIIVVSAFKTDGKTQKMQSFLKKLPIENFINKNVVLVIASSDEQILRSTRNLVNVEALRVGNLNTYKILASDWLIIEKEALKNLEEIFLKEKKH